MSLINRSKVKQFILERWASKRAHMLTRVSNEAFVAVEAALIRAVDRMIDEHPSKGKTFQP
jgi:hypothetical protein